MSDGKLYAKAKSSELRAELERAYKKTKHLGRVLIVMKKVIANIMLNNNELLNLFPDIINVMRIDNFEIRKACFQYLVKYAKHSAADAREALPFLSRLKNDSNPKMRALSLKTMSSIPLGEYIDLSINTIRELSKDKDPYVRCIAAFAVSRVYQHASETATSANLIEELNTLLYDNDETVVSNTLASLGYITENGKTLTLNIDYEHAKSLLSFLDRTSEWSQVYLLNALMSYVPQTTEDALVMIEGVLPCLQHENAAIILNSVKVIVYYSNYVRNPELIIPTLPKRLGSSLVSLLSKPPEIQFLVLRNVILLLLGKKELLNFDVEMFFCHFEDPIYIKDTKLEIIYLVANEHNAHLVLNELEEYATEIDVSMARKAIRAFGNLAVKLDSIADECVAKIFELVSNEIPYIVRETATIMKNILRKYPNRYLHYVNDIAKYYQLIDEPDAKCSMIWILGQYCETINRADVILGYLLSNLKEDPVEVQCAALTAVTKFYLKMPEKGEILLLNTFKIATEESDNPDFRDRGYMYWRLLTSEEANGSNGEILMNAKEIILSSDLLISIDNDNIDPEILQELELTIGSLASIYLKPVTSIFRLCKRKELPYSPALQERKQVNSSSSSASGAAFTGPSLKVSTPEPVIQGRMSSISNYGPPSRPMASRSSSMVQSLDLSSSKTKSKLARRISRKASILKRKN